MNNDRWTKIETLVEQALALPPAERDAFIENQCGEDEALRDEIQSLLEHGDKALSFMGHFEEEVVAPSIDHMAQSQFDKDHRIDAQFGHYHITDILGRGGMGIVYKARDTKLDRTVALKFLPSHLTRSEKDKQRFIREAKAAAALNHSNICTIYSVEEHEGQHFISMEYIDGQTLREKFESEDLTPEKALNYAIHLAEALAEAHEKGIVHRDIKPGNIMVDSKDRIKVMDFGLAKPVDSTPITQTGTTLGTMAYMSPEQIQGRPVDHRADLFSFGVLLFEMLAGQRPFTGQYDAALTYSIVHEKPPPLTDFLPEAPQQLTKLVSQLLEKDPAKRYSDSEQLAYELKKCLETLPDQVATSKVIQSVQTAPEQTGSNGSSSITINIPPKARTITLAGLLIVILGIGYWFLSETDAAEPKNYKIAVLPLESTSTEPEDILFTEGVHEELINRLTGISDLAVIARRSVLEFPSDERHDLRSIGEKLGVSTLMDGTVRRIGDQLRVSVQLIDANSLTTLWSGSFDESIDNIFEIQSRIARQVASELEATLTPEEDQQLEQRPTDNPQAFRYYMQGRAMLSQGVSQENLINAEKLLRDAVDQDREFAQAWGMLGHVYSNKYWLWGRHPEDLLKLKEVSEWALFYGPELPETYLSNGALLYWTNTNHRQTLAHFNVALQKYPNDPLLLLMTAVTHRRLGNWDELINHLKKGLEYDPLNLNLRNELIYDYFLIRDYKQAKLSIEQAREISGNNLNRFNMELSLGLADEGNFEEFEELLDRIHPSDPIEVLPYAWARYNLFKRNWNEAFRAYNSANVEILISNEAMYLLKNYMLGSVLEFQGKYSEAITYYEQAKLDLEALRDQYPEEPRYHSELGKVYARLGDFEKAIKEGEKATELVPFRQNADISTIYGMNLAEIYTWTDNHELAIDQIEFFLSVPGHVAHRNLIRFDPRWDPLRDNPRFQELIAGEDEPYLKGI